MDDFYCGDKVKRHQSPTKRLMQQKNACWDHKTKIKSSVRHSQSYKLHYTASPDKSYVIEPKGGELDYELAYRNPVKFYNQVMT